jgi:biotin transport system substrate-specific component
MTMHLETTIKQQANLIQTIKSGVVSSLQILVGSLFLSLMAQIAFPLPFTPVPVTLQTFGVACLAMTLGRRKATLAVLAYLTEATYGLPVLGGGLANPFWMLSARGGYALAFILAAFLVGKLLEQKRPTSFGKSWLILALNEGLILTIGTLWMTGFVGFNAAISMGFLPFIPGALVKISMAAATWKGIQAIKAKG